jgi:hypothetical protein
MMKLKKNNTKNHPSQPNNQIFEDEIEKKNSTKKRQKKTRVNRPNP